MARVGRKRRWRQSPPDVLKALMCSARPAAAAADSIASSVCRVLYCRRGRDFRNFRKWDTYGDRLEGREVFQGERIEITAQTQSGEL